jgi:RNA ligase
MKYKFPIITHIDQILKAIEGRDEFIICDKGDYRIVNYVYKTDTTFPMVSSEQDALLRECRGIMFDRDGNLISRTYHKFFNVNERPETLEAVIDFNKNHFILEKLDGSMIRPFSIGNGIRWGTKMGETDISAQAEAYLKSVKKIAYMNLAMECIESNCTPIFEWCSRQNRVVIDHAQDKLVLTAIRNNWSGAYYPYDIMKQMADHYGVPVVRSFDTSVTDVQKFIAETRSLQDIEGYVVRFDDGHMLKVKADLYMRIHSFKDLVSSESKVVNVVINGQLDDVIGIPDILEDDKKRVQKYAKDFYMTLQAEAQGLGAVLAALHTEGISRKDFALRNIMEPLRRGLVFSLWDKDMAKTDKMTVMNAIATVIKKNSTNNKNFAKVKNEFFKELVYA